MYNVESYIGDCLSSIYQSYDLYKEAIQVILIDDESTDQTLAHVGYA